MLAFRALALMELDLTDEALALTRECLRFEKRDPALLRFVRYVRGRTFERTGKAAMAKKEFARHDAEDTAFAATDRNSREAGLGEVGRMEALVVLGHRPTHRRPGRFPWLR